MPLCEETGGHRQASAGRNGAAVVGDDGGAVSGVSEGGLRRAGAEPLHPLLFDLAHRLHRGAWRGSRLQSLQFALHARARPCTVTRNLCAARSIIAPAACRTGPRPALSGPSPLTCYLGLDPGSRLVGRS